MRNKNYRLQILPKQSAHENLAIKKQLYLIKYDKHFFEIIKKNKIKMIKSRKELKRTC